jgi:TonB family protein
VQSPPEEVTTETIVEPEPPPEPELPDAISVAPEIAPPPLPLAPDSQAPLPPGQDAPSNQPPTPTREVVDPLTSKTGDTALPPGGSGPLTNPEGKGRGFGNNPQPTGFSPLGKPEGKPDGKPDGKPEGNATRTSAPAAPAPPAQSPRRTKPVCVSCPKPAYRGSEGSPRVTYDIAPDGSVTNVRLRRSSGDPDSDRAAVEAISKWRFDPQSIPTEGQRGVRVRVTFEEAGSTYQRQNQQRRRQQSEQHHQAEQEQQRRGIPESASQEPPPQTRPAVPMEPTPSPALAPATPAATPDLPPAPDSIAEPSPLPPAPAEPTPEPVVPALEPPPAVVPAPEPTPVEPATPTGDDAQQGG